MESSVSLVDEVQEGKLAICLPAHVTHLFECGTETVIKRKRTAVPCFAISTLLMPESPVKPKAGASRIEAI